MSDEIEAVTESAKAVQEVAKTGGKIIDAGSALGKWLGHVLGTIPEDLVGLTVGDPLYYLRVRRAIAFLEKTREKLERRAITNTKPIRDKLLLPTVQGASEESDETLQDLWVNLLANAMDPDTDVELQEVFIETLRRLDPLDALILNHYANGPYPTPNKEPYFTSEVAKLFGVRATRAQAAAHHLEQLRCLDHRRAGVVYAITALGVELHLATQPKERTDQGCGTGSP